MIAQAQNIENKLLNDRERVFCKLMVPGRITATEAYRQAGYSHNGAKANSSRLIAKDSIKTEIRCLRAELAIKDGITQEIQATKLEDLRIRCKNNDDSTGENAAIREQNKLYGLSIDKTQTDQADAQKARTAVETAQAERYAEWCLEDELRQQRASEGVVEHV